jgi:hypothetical protein
MYERSYWFIIYSQISVIRVKKEVNVGEAKVRQTMLGISITN